MKYKKDNLFKDLRTGEIIQVHYITCGDYACMSFDGEYELKNKEVKTYFDLPKEELENEKLYLPLKISEDNVTIKGKKFNKPTELSNELIEIQRLKKTLAEIKEISENVIKNVSDICIETTPMFCIHKQIIQKISECEV